MSPIQITLNSSIELREKIHTISATLLKIVDEYEALQQQTIVMDDPHQDIEALEDARGEKLGELYGQIEQQKNKAIKLFEVFDAALHDRETIDRFMLEAGGDIPTLRQNISLVVREFRGLYTSNTLASSEFHSAIGQMIDALNDLFATSWERQEYSKERKNPRGKKDNNDSSNVIPFDPSKKRPK